MDIYVYSFIFIYSYVYLLICIYVSLISSAQSRPNENLETQVVQATVNAKSAAFLYIHYVHVITYYILVT